MQAGTAGDQDEAIVWKLEVPGQYLVAGPSQGGKSRLILQLVKNNAKVFAKPFRNVFYVAPGAGTSDKKYVEELGSACESCGLGFSSRSAPPDVEEIKKSFPEEEGLLLILDDLLMFGDYGKELAEISNVASHHSNITCFYTLQNPFAKTKLDLVSLTRNLNGRFLLYSLNDFRMFSTIGSSIFPRRASFVEKCVVDARTKGYNYIFLNTSVRSNLKRENICYTRLFENEEEGPLFFDLHRFYEDDEDEDDDGGKDQPGPVRRKRGAPSADVPASKKRSKRKKLSH